MEQKKIDPQQIPGWGIDANPDNNPAYPMKKGHIPVEAVPGGMQYPIRQVLQKEVLRSMERPYFSAVVGTTLPPKGLSGAVRRLAFRFTESEYGHWLPLLLADRINVWEGLVDDVRKGKLPNYWAERGMAAEWKYNRVKVICKLALYAVAIGFVSKLIITKIKSKSSV